MKPIQNSLNEIESALSDLIDGQTVIRSKFLLNQNQTDLTKTFENILTRKSYNPKKLTDIQLEFGFRYPAFYINYPKHIAYFGWVVWEKFHYLNHRKIWISEVRDIHGDWEHYFQDSDDEFIWVNESKPIAMEMENLKSR